MQSALLIRKMTESDKNFIVGLSSRFNEFSFMNWRDQNKMQEAQKRMAEEAVNLGGEDDEIFVVEDENAELVGFIHLAKNEDYFTGEPQGYVSTLAVAKNAEGKGVAKKLMLHAEEWAKSKGYKQLVLNVFSRNERALNFYSHLNYEKEIVKMVKEL